MKKDDAHRMKLRKTKNALKKAALKGSPKKTVKTLGARASAQESAFNEDIEPLLTQLEIHMDKEHV